MFLPFPKILLIMLFLSYDTSAMSPVPLSSYMVLCLFKIASTAGGRAMSSYTVTTA